MAIYAGTPGNDIYMGGNDADDINGGGGNDQLSGGGGADILVGGSGADTLSGGEGNDNLYSADRAGSFGIPLQGYPLRTPTLDTGTEYDRLFGGAGDDKIFAGYGDDVDGGESGPFGDLLYISFLGAPTGVTFNAGLSTQIIGGGTITGMDGVDWLQGSNFDDNLSLSGPQSGFLDYGAVFGMGGNDRLTAGYHTRYMDGGDGDDVLSGIGAGYLSALMGGAGNDTIYTSGNSFAAIYGGDGDDRIFTNGTISGGGGDDYIEVIQSYHQGFVDGDEGNDEIHGAENTSGILIGGSGADRLFGANLDDRISTHTVPVSTTGAKSYFGDDLALDHDVVEAGAGNDLVSGGFGDDLDGGTGDDQLRYSLAGLQAGIDFDTSILLTGQPAVVGGGTVQNFESLVYLRGTEFNDVLRLGTQDAQVEVVAGNGDDLVITGGSSANVSGGAGNDTFVSGIAGDLFDGGDGSDTVTYQAYAAAVAATLGDGSVAGSGAGGDQLVRIENLIGSALGDTLTGNNGANLLQGGDGNDVLNGAGGNDTLFGDGGDDQLNGGVGADLLNGGIGNDQIDGGAGNDTLIGGAGTDVLRGGSGIDVVRDTVAGHDRDTILDFSSQDVLVFTDATLGEFNYSLEGNLLTYSGGSITLTGRQGGYLIASAAEGGGVQLKLLPSIAEVPEIFRPSGQPLVANFNLATGWSSQELYPRHIADMNGDGNVDIVGFGTTGVLVSYGSANGSFGTAGLVVENFGQVSGWTNDDLYHRALVDLNGDGRADIVGFGTAGTLVSLSKAAGGFTTAGLVAANFGKNQGWSSQDSYTRLTGDINGDGKADIVGFGQAGTLVALGNGDGSFQASKVALFNFGFDQGWTSDRTYHRELADVNGDGKADLIGFGASGTYVALSNGDGTFKAARQVLSDFGTAQGWTSNDSNPRLVADVNGDRVADIVGFTNGGSVVAFGIGDGTFLPARPSGSDFGREQGWLSDLANHRELADVNRDGFLDIVGFGAAGVLVGLNNLGFMQ